ncbi:MAG TPA: ATP-binding protein [Rugosimonospora sp.]|nr:ATP-binding protein [Rugosimonospora sp.]
MRRHWGLRAKMAGSYVLVTAAAVAVVEIVVLAIVVPGLLSGGPDRTLLVELTARDEAALAADAAVRLGRLPQPGEFPLGERGLTLAPGEARPTADGSGVRIPYETQPLDTDRPMSMALLIALDGSIAASSYPARYPPGRYVGTPGVGILPIDVIAKFTGAVKPAAGGSKTPDGEVLWAVAPVVLLSAAPDPVKTDKARAMAPAGLIYVQVPAAAKLPVRVQSGTGPNLWASLAAQLAGGLAVLLLALPVGAVFGLLSTRRLIGRLRHLAASTVAVAEGDYQRRVPVAGHDEVAALETSFNRMAERLAEAMAAQRQLAGASERARIARELHDSISQDLFSLRLLAGGLRRALPAGSPLHASVETMERTAAGTMQEMQALLLELRPVALKGTGLLAALEELCEAYRDRLGVAVDAELEPVALAPAAEPQVLRIVQEALANAVKHARPARIALRVHRVGDQVSVTVTDDGAGFDPQRAAARHGLGLGLMRERVAELGGEFQLESIPGRGTAVRVLIPAAP